MRHPLKTLGILLVLAILPFAATGLFASDTTSPEDSFKVQLPTVRRISAAELQDPNFCVCTVTRGNNTNNLPYFSAPESALSFYSYGVPLGSCANSGFEQSNQLLVLLYEDTNTGEVSFIMIADIANDGSGGTLKADIRCAPSGSAVALSDDGGELTGASPTFNANFVWDACCTDGGIISGMGCGSAFTLDITTITGIDVITILYGTPASPNYVQLPASACPLIFNCEGTVCCENAFTVEGTVEKANCGSSTDGAIDVEVEGDCLGTLEFEWSNGDTEEDIDGLAPGTYTVTVTDPNGCSQEATFTVGVEYNDPVPVIEGPSAFCAGESALLYVTGNYNSYLWSNGETTFSILVDEPGTYSVTVTNEGGCVGEASFTIQENPVPIVAISGPKEICPGAVITLDAGPGFTLYDWSTGGFSQTTLVTDPGTYFVVVTNEFGCTSQASYEVTGLTAPLPLITGPSSICAGQTATLETQDDFSSYKWSTGDSLYQITIKGPGTYSVTVTNGEGCKGVANWTVLNGIALPLSILGDTITCPGDSVLLTASFPYVSYQWSTKDSTAQLLAAAPGTYTLIVLDSLGCRDTASLQVGVRPAADPQIAGKLVLCQGESSTLSISGGFATVNWSNGSTGNSITVTLPGPYSVAVQDSAGCRGTDTVVVQLNPVDSIFQQASSCDPADVGTFVTTLTNQYGCDSVVVLKVTFQLGDTTLIAKTTCDLKQAGTQSFQLTNQFGCDSLVVVNTTFIPSDTLLLKSTTCDPAKADTSILHLTNQGGCDSTVIVQVALLPSSTESYTFKSCNPADTGIVVKQLVNQFGCDSIVTWITLLVPEDSCVLKVNPEALPGPCANDPGAIRLIAQSGTFPVQVSWRPLAGGPPQNGTWAGPQSPFLIPALPTGSYILELIDSKGKPWSDTLFLSAASPLTAQLIGPASANGYDLACYGDATATLQVTGLVGGTPPVSFDWSTGVQGPQIGGLKAGTYAVTLTDAKGCTLVLADTLTQPPALQAGWTVFQDPCDGKPSPVSQTALSGGVAPYTLLLNDTPLGGASWPELPAGSARLTVRDANGCLVDTILIVQPEGIFSIDLGPDIFTEEGTLIKLLAQLLPDTTTLQAIQWSPALCPNCLNPAIRVKEPMTVTVTAINAAGCQATDYVVIELDVRNVFIPNSFSPDLDGINDRFAPFGDPEVTVVDFQVFDRWGNAVYSGGGFQLGDPDHGWDGTFRDKVMHIDVYAYALVLRWPDGKEKLYKGDLQLLR